MRSAHFAFLVLTLTCGAVACGADPGGEAGMSLESEAGMMNAAGGSVAMNEPAQAEPSVEMDQEPTAQAPSFAQDIHPIFTAKCSQSHGGCHSEAPYAGSAMYSWAQSDVGAAKASAQMNIDLLITRVGQGQMPPTQDKVTEAELALIRAWQMTGFAD